METTMTTLDHAAAWAQHKGLTFDEYRALVDQYNTDREYYSSAGWSTCFKHCQLPR